MNFTKKIAMAASAVIFTSTTVMAQVDGEVPYVGNEPITFEVTVEQIAKLVVDDYGLTGGDGENGDTYLTLADNGELVQGNNILTNILGISEEAGTVIVTTNINPWDVTLVAKYGGALYKEGQANTSYAPDDIFQQYPIVTQAEGQYLRATGLMNQAYGDEKARIEVSVCIEKGEGTTDCTAATSTRITTNFDGTTPNLEVSLARAMGYTSGFGVKDTDAEDTKSATFTIYAKVPFTEAELSGNGTYREEFEFILDYFL